MGSNEQSLELQGGARRLGAVSARIEGVSPDVLLNLETGVPRGFWAREGRWFAHLGVTATLDVSDPLDGPRRFPLVWSRAQELLEASTDDPESEVKPPRPRLFGGFAFRETHVADGPWEGFPSAKFVLPEVELKGGAGTGTLTCRAFLEAGEDPKRCRERLRERLEQIKDALQRPPSGEGEGDVWIPATRVETEKGHWTEAVDRALDAMLEGEISKVVLARVQTVSAEGGLDAVDVAMNLWRDNPAAHVFLFEPTPGRVLLGAAPETVATVSDRGFRATAVAGSIGTGDSPDGRQGLAEDLLNSAKDLREHEMCVQDMVRRLEPISQHVLADEKPHILTLSTIQHLETVIQAQILPGEHVLSVLDALHPTPAVCGLPRDLALDFLKTEEQFQRGWYSGPVGWFDGSGDGVFVPALRSAVGMGTEWRLFAGAGIVAGSDPGREWDETRIKFQPVLRALAHARAEGSTPVELGAEEV